jgi:hypothetical protein
LREIADSIERKERPNLLVTEAYSLQSVSQEASAITLILALRFFYTATDLIQEPEPEKEAQHEDTAGEVSERPTAVAFAKLIGENREAVSLPRRETAPKLREIADLIEQKIAGVIPAREPWGLMQACSMQSARISAWSTAVLILRFVDL